jgi:MerR family transcriptional regulator, light-induced transcriptional regulator
MYTIKQAAARVGVTVPVLRAWERRYGIVEPGRTPSGYRLYDEAAIARLSTMQRLVDSGWSPSTAAAAIIAGTAPPDAPSAMASASDRESSIGVDTNLREGFVAAAAGFDSDELERRLDEMFAMGTFERMADEHLLPAVVALGDAWADGRIDVAAEHMASHAVLRRLAAAYQAAGRPVPASGGVLVGLPPGSRHELGGLAFAVAARRAGLPIVYLGPDLPVADWVATAERLSARAAVIGSVTPADRGPARSVADALVAQRPGILIAFGGSFPPADDTRSFLRLPRGLSTAVAALAGALGAPLARSAG